LSWAHKIFREIKQEWGQAWVSYVLALEMFDRYNHFDENESLCSIENLLVFSEQVFGDDNDY